MEFVLHDVLIYIYTHCYLYDEYSFVYVRLCTLLTYVCCYFHWYYFYLAHQQQHLQVQGVWKMIDLDSARRIGTEVNPLLDGFKWTTSIGPPELAHRVLWGGKACLPPLVADPSIDVFMLGALFFEIVTRTSLLTAIDHNDDSLTTDDSRLELFVWIGIDEKRLSRCFVADDSIASNVQKEQCHALLRGMLRGDRNDRLSMVQVLEHPFLKTSDWAAMKTSTKPLDLGITAHFYISHLPSEASQHATALALLIEKQTTCITWTRPAARERVIDSSDVSETTVTVRLQEYLLTYF